MFLWLKLFCFYNFLKNGFCPAAKSTARGNVRLSADNNVALPFWWFKTLAASTKNCGYNNKFKKSSYEALCYGRALADKIGGKVCGVVINCSNTENLNVIASSENISVKLNEKLINF